jgi:hypothetical protein
MNDFYRFGDNIIEVMITSKYEPGTSIQVNNSSYDGNLHVGLLLPPN